MQSSDLLTSQVSFTMAGNEGLHHQNSALEGFMSIFKDIRNASVIIADSIRTRELNALRASGLIQEPSRCNMENDRVSGHPRCPICMEAFYDETVASSVCGHGMHSTCAELFLPSNDPGNVKLCGICRSPMSRKDIVILKGILPQSENIAAWKMVVLTQPWECTDAVEEPDSRRGIDGTLERLLMSIKSLYRVQNNFSRAMGQVMEFYKEIKTENEEEKKPLQKLRKNLAERERKLDQKDAYLAEYMIREENIVPCCTDNILREEAKLQGIVDNVIRKQLKLQRLNADVRSNEEDPQNRIKDFEEQCEQRNKALEKMRDTIEAERKQLRSTHDAPPDEEDTSGRDAKRPRSDVDDAEGACDVIEILPSPPSCSTNESPLNRRTRKAKRVRID